MPAQSTATAQPPRRRRIPGEARYLELEGRGRIRVWEIEGPPGAPTLLLLHGLGATGPLNWFQAFPALADQYRVIAVDHRGHGQGIRTRRFRLKDCADDAIAVAEALGVDRLIAVGYSMGGPIAKLCWSRHPDRVSGLVLCATAQHFSPDRYPVLTRALLPGAVVGARIAPGLVRGQIIEGMLRGVRSPEARKYMRMEMSPSDPATLAQATRAVLAFSSRNWASSITVPTAVVVMTRDEVVPTRRQERLAAAIPNAQRFDVQGDHFACANERTNFIEQLTSACAYVTRESNKR